ncbi:MAG: hypothetical protein SGJ20_14075 [Planctomycetota bacterium]|nr:hypothetical protein [Planctomycetota bacterium]
MFGGTTATILCVFGLIGLAFDPSTRNMASILKFLLMIPVCFAVGLLWGYVMWLMVRWQGRQRAIPSADSSASDKNG